MERPSSVPITKENAQAFLDSVDTFLLDCDGMYLKGIFHVPALQPHSIWLKTAPNSRSIVARFFSHSGRPRNIRVAEIAGTLGVLCT